MLTSVYIPQVQALLQNPAAPTPLYSTSQITTAINLARLQIAGEGQCIHGTATSTNSGSGGQVWPFSAFTISLPSSGCAGIFNVRQLSFFSGTQTLQYVNFQPYEYFFRYYVMVNITATSATPTYWSQQGQGVNGTVLIYPPATSGVELLADATLEPIALASDSDPEAIPYPWQDCVQYLAAWYCLLQSQSGARQADADRMFARYTEFSMRARNTSTAQVLPGMFSASGRIPPAAAAGG